MQVHVNRKKDYQRLLSNHKNTLNFHFYLILYIGVYFIYIKVDFKYY